MQHFVKILFHLSLFFFPFFHSHILQISWKIVAITQPYCNDCCYPRSSIRFIATIDDIHTTNYIWLMGKFLLFNFISFLSGKTSDIRNFVFCFVFRSLDFRFIDKLPVQRKRPHTASSTNLQTKKAIFYACKSAEHTKYIRIFSIQFRYILHFLHLFIAICPLLSYIYIVIYFTMKML